MGKANKEDLLREGRVGVEPCPLRQRTTTKMLIRYVIRKFNDHFLFWPHYGGGHAITFELNDPTSSGSQITFSQTVSFKRVLFSSVKTLSLC